MPNDSEKKEPLVDVASLENDYISRPAETPLRICCYGSSSAKTPDKFLKEAWSLGYILAKRGHTCVNGAGSFGCMASMNDGADAGNGHIVGVIHEMFLVDGNDWLDRDGGAHGVFSKQNQAAGIGPTREILIAGGSDLQERKRLLVEGAEALVVLPGGPGTWDELWEMACARNLGLTNLPIVCVSVDGYYESFRTMLARAYNEGLVKNKPEDVAHFVSSAEEAVQWVESYKANASSKDGALPKVQSRASVLRKASFFAPPTFLRSSISWISSDSDDGIFAKLRQNEWTFPVLAFSAGISVGLLSATHSRNRQR